MSAQKGVPGFGDKLREARERRGLSLRQIANATKISVGVLEALERNDISKLPGGIFGRAFVRSYASEVGLDPEATIQDFIAQFPNDSVTAGHPASAFETLTGQPDRNHHRCSQDEAWPRTFFHGVGRSRSVFATGNHLSTTLRRGETCPILAPGTDG